MTDEIDLRHLLLPKGALVHVGIEHGDAVQDGIAAWSSEVGMRYVLMQQDNAIAALQIVEVSPGRGMVAGVYTRTECRRQGLATGLLQRAKRDFDTIEHIVTMTKDGRAWAAAVTRAQPWRHGQTTQIVEVTGISDEVI